MTLMQTFMAAAGRCLASRNRCAIAIRSYVHLFSDHTRAAIAQGWTFREMHEGLIDEAWLTKKPKWQAQLGRPISYAIVWQRA